jgi:hypothetical protein
MKFAIRPLPQSEAGWHNLLYPTISKQTLHLGDAEAKRLTLQPDPYSAHLNQPLIPDGAVSCKKLVYV